MGGLLFLDNCGCRLASKAFSKDFRVLSWRVHNDGHRHGLAGNETITLATELLVEFLVVKQDISKFIGGERDGKLDERGQTSWLVSVQVLEQSRSGPKSEAASVTSTLGVSVKMALETNAVGFSAV